MEQLNEHKKFHTSNEKKIGLLIVMGLSNNEAVQDVRCVTAREKLNGDGSW